MKGNLKFRNIEATVQFKTSDSNRNQSSRQTCKQKHVKHNNAKRKNTAHINMFIDVH